MLKHLDLFSGIGGFTLACQWAGIETIGFVEIDKYCQKVLGKRFPGVPIVEDIRDVEKIKEIVAYATGIRFQIHRERGSLQQQGAFASCDSGNRTEGGNNRDSAESPAILITAGFPCQPFSVAGKRQGEGDDRYLWPETLAVIEAVKPKWVLLENVTGIINLALDTVLSDLEGAGYFYETLIIPACAVNAWHRRDRIWIIAVSTGDGQRGQVLREFREDNGATQARQKDATKTSRPQVLGNLQGRGSQEVPIADTRLLGQEKPEEQATGIKQCGEDAANSRSPESGGLSGKQRQENTEIRHSDWWAVEPELGRVAHGIPNRVDRLKCLGNAIVPQVAYEIIKVIKEVEDG